MVIQGSWVSRKHATNTLTIWLLQDIPACCDNGRTLGLGVCLCVQRWHGTFFPYPTHCSCSVVARTRPLPGQRMVLLSVCQAFSFFRALYKLIILPRGEVWFGNQRSRETNTHHHCHHSAASHICLEEERRWHKLLLKGIWVKLCIGWQWVTCFA